MAFDTEHISGRTRIKLAIREETTRYDLEIPCLVISGKRNHKYKGRDHVQISIDGKPWQAHRYIWFINNGPIGKGMLICHKCDNPPCIELSHLYEGTELDNVYDRMERGRGGGPHYGEEHHFAKLTWDQVDTIRRRYRERNISCEKLAKEYGVTGGAIKKIVTYETWPMAKHP